jgi:peptide/nickel transport system permease protein
VLTFTAKRLVAGAVLLVAICVLTYALLFSAGNNIARNILGENATEEQVAAKTVELGLDQPLVTRFVDWVSGAVTGDLGRSWFNSEAVLTALLNRLPVTLTLVVVAILLTAVAATVLGLVAAVRGGWADRIVQVSAVIGDAIPSFVLAILLVLVVAIQFALLPATSTISPGVGLGPWVASLALPVLALVVNGVTSAAQQIRSAVLKEMERDYVRTLRSRGLPEREILLAHVLRSAAPAGLTVLSLQFVGMLGGVVILEQVFALPGVGSLAVAATTQGDVPVVMGVVVYTVLIVLVVNFLVDLANGWLNPKVRVS